jgi:hypothetical protein
MDWSLRLLEHAAEIITTAAFFGARVILVYLSKDGNPRPQDYEAK